MKTVDKILDLVMRFIMAIAMFGLLVFGFWQIFSRFVLGDPSTFTDEMLRYLLIWASLIGSAYCFYKDEHLSLTLVKDRVNGKVLLVLNIFIELCVLFFVGYVFIYGGYKLMLTGGSKSSSVMRIPYNVLYAIIPVSGVMIYVARVLKYIQMFTESRNGGDK